MSELDNKICFKLNGLFLSLIYIYTAARIWRDKWRRYGEISKWDYFNEGEAKRHEFKEKYNFMEINESYNFHISWKPIKYLIA